MGDSNGDGYGAPPGPFGTDWALLIVAGGTLYGNGVGAGLSGSTGMALDEDLYGSITRRGDGELYDLGSGAGDAD